MRDRGRERLAGRAGVRLGFSIHLAAYVLVNLLLAVINLATTPQYLWFLWSLAGWGIGIAFHALAAFVFGTRS